MGGGNGQDACDEDGSCIAKIVSTLQAIFVSTRYRAQNSLRTIQVRGHWPRKRVAPRVSAS
jgi:hypothetical protein